MPSIIFWLSAKKNPYRDFLLPQRYESFTLVPRPLTTICFSSSPSSLISLQLIQSVLVLILQKGCIVYIYIYIYIYLICYSDGCDHWDSVNAGATGCYIFGHKTDESVSKCFFKSFSISKSSTPFPLFSFVFLHIVTRIKNFVVNIAKVCIHWFIHKIVQIFAYMVD